jgi:hypothetical protein
MLRGARSRDWNYCLALVYNKFTGVTNSIVHGLEQKEIDKLQFCLQKSWTFTSHPMLLPVTLIELKIHHFAKLLELRAQGLEVIEFETGMRHGFSNDRRRNPPREERLKMREKLDFDLILQKLTGLASTIAFCEITFNAGLRSLELVEKVGQNLEASGDLEDSEKGLTMPPLLIQRIEYLKQLIAGAQDTRKLLQERKDAQMQTVCIKAVIERL